MAGWADRFAGDEEPAAGLLHRLRKSRWRTLAFGRHSTWPLRVPQHLGGL
ncbi:unnamed protein product [Effrenium voratum]|nr:unnamed protein product [Effrenium voratum]